MTGYLQERVDKERQKGVRGPLVTRKIPEVQNRKGLTICQL